VFHPLKKALKGLRFGSDEDVKAAVVQRHQQQQQQRCLFLTAFIPLS
jgi:hypothetical protein